MKISPFDLYFCEKVRKAGFKMYVDTDVCMSHIGLAIYSIKGSEDQKVGTYDKHKRPLRGN